MCALLLVALLAVPVRGQTPPLIPPQSAALAPAVAPPVGPLLPPPTLLNDQLAKELEELRQEVAESRLLKQQVRQLQRQVGSLEREPRHSEPLPPVNSADDPCCVLGEDAFMDAKSLPVITEYKYNFGGGYLSFRTPDDTFTLNIQNQLTADGTFYGLEDANTLEKGFNLPFYRLYAMGNLLENWEYLASVQHSLGSFNILDMYMGYLFCDELNIRVGHFLSPFLYEYWAFSPAWEPVITNSPMFQFAGKRQTGAMLWGRLFENTFQYQVGAFNGPEGSYFDLDRNIDTIASLTWTPFKPYTDSALSSLGGGFSIENGRQDYLLSSGTRYNFPFGNGEPTLNQNFVNSSGLEFFLYNDNVSARGNRFKVAPHIFWFGRFNLLAEYVYWNRALTDGTNSTIENIHAFYANASYFLTGERYTGDGLLGYTTVEPLNSYGAWELAFQFSQIQIGTSVIDAGFVDPSLNATRMDQVMSGVNWWPNRYVRLSFDYVHVWTNQSVDVGAGQFADQYGIWWGRAAAFF